MILTVDASSLLPMTYKWFRNGIEIPGATKSTYTKSDVSYLDAGTYYAEVRNLIGGINSASATVTVLYPQLRFVSPRMAANGYRMQLVGPGSASYIIWATTDMQNWLPIATNTAMSGSCTWVDTTALPAEPVANEGPIPQSLAVARVNQRFYRASSVPVGVLEQNLSGDDKIDVRTAKKGTQSFKHGVAGGASYMINRIVINLSRESTLPNTNAMLYISTALSSGILSATGALINPSTITNTSGGNSFQTYEIIYDTPVGPFTAGTTYYLNLECEASNGAKVFWEYANRNSYANGTYYQGGSDKSCDAYFEIWGQ